MSVDIRECSEGQSVPSYRPESSPLALEVSLESLLPLEFKMASRRAAALFLASESDIFRAVGRGRGWMDGTFVARR